MFCANKNIIRRYSKGTYRSIIAMRGATIEAALAADRKSAPSRDVKFLVFHVFLLAVICSGVVVPARASAGASESFMIPLFLTIILLLFVKLSVFGKSNMTGEEKRERKQTGEE